MFVLCGIELFILLIALVGFLIERRRGESFRDYFNRKRRRDAAVRR